MDKLGRRVGKPAIIDRGEMQGLLQTRIMMYTFEQSPIKSISGVALSCTHKNEQKYSSYVKNEKTGLEKKVQILPNFTHPTAWPTAA